MNATLGTGELVRIALRRDRIMLPAWLAALALLAVGSAAATIALYADLPQIVEAAAAVNQTPALVAVYGQVYDQTSLGAVSMFKAGGTGSLLVALLAIVLVVRHTRGEEDTGRLELLGSGAIGRLAALTSALVVACGGAVVLGAVTAVGLMATGLPVAGSLTFGLSWICVQTVFAAVAAIAVQLAGSGRAAIGLGLGALGVSFLVRAVGDTGPTWLSWLSPLGLAQQVRPYAGDRWWVALVLLTLAAAGAAAAYRLAARRDLGAGLLVRRNRVHRTTPHSPLGLALRLQRGTLAAWVAGFACYGLLIGSVASGMRGMLDNPALRDTIEQLGGANGLSDAVLAAMLGMLGIASAAYGIQAAVRMRTEEHTGRLEPVLAAPVGRLRWALGHLTVALGGSTVLLATAGLTAGIAHAVQTGAPVQVTRVLGGALAQAPAAWVLTGITMALFGFAPRIVAASWAVLVGFLLLGELGPLLRLRQWAMDLSPFAHLPKLPGGVFSTTPLLWLTLVAVLLAAAGLAGLRRRDIG